MKVSLVNGSSGDGADYHAVFSVTLQLLNQLSDSNHYTQRFECTFKGQPMGLVTTNAFNYITFNELYKRQVGVQYLKDDCLKFRVWVNVLNGRHYKHKIGTRL